MIWALYDGPPVLKCSRRLHPFSVALLIGIICPGTSVAVGLLHKEPGRHWVTQYSLLGSAFLPQDFAVVLALADLSCSSLVIVLSQGFAIPKEAQSKVAKLSYNGQETELKHGDLVIAAITSCTNTSNPMVMLGAGLVAKKAAEKGLFVAPHIKTSLAPGSGVVTHYLQTRWDRSTT